MINHSFTGKELKQGGIQVAVDNAEKHHPGWQDEAYDALLSFLQWHRTAFLCETFRVYAETEHQVPPPPTDRVYGAVIQRAKREGKIVHAGYAQVANPKAHMANASLWIRTPKEIA